MKNILLAVDFPDSLTPLVDKTIQLAQAFGAKVWLVHVAAPEPDFVGYDAGPQEVRDEVARHLRKEHADIQQLAQIFQENKVEAEALLVQGSTAETILEETKKLQADLLVFGYHQHSFFHKILIGSTAKEIIRNAAVPMLVVPLD